MVRRIIVQKGHQRIKNAADDHAIFYTFSGLIVCLFIIITSRMLISIITNVIQLPNYMRSEYIVTLAALLVGFFMIVVRRKQVSENNKNSAIYIYPIGIQLCTLQRHSDKHHKDNNCEEQYNVVKYGTFIPIDLIIDCVVTEVLLVTKVVNCIVVRLKHSINEYDNIQSSSSEPLLLNDSIQLINIFPDTNISYVQCLSIRKEIMNHNNEIKSL